MPGDLVYAHTKSISNICFKFSMSQYPPVAHTSLDESVSDRLSKKRGDNTNSKTQADYINPLA